MNVIFILLYFYRIGVVIVVLDLHLILLKVHGVLVHFVQFIILIGDKRNN